MIIQLVKRWSNFSLGRLNLWCINSRCKVQITCEQKFPDMLGPSFLPHGLRTWQTNWGTIVWASLPSVGPIGQQSWLATGWEVAKLDGMPEFPREGRGHFHVWTGLSPTHNVLRKYHILGHGHNPSLESWLQPSPGHLHTLRSLVGDQLGQLSVFSYSTHPGTLECSSHSWLINT